MPASFTHLHVHSHFSLLAGVAPVTALAARAAADGLPSLALTDLNALYGAVAFAQACHKTGVQPLVGMTLALAPPDDLAAPLAGPGLLVLLATGSQGYRSLNRLSTALQAHPDRLPRAAQGLDWDTLRANRVGLICVDAGRQGWIARLLRQDQPRAAAGVLSRLAGIFDENFYLGLEWHRPEDLPVMAALHDLGRRFGAATVAAQPIYCLQPEEQPRLRLLAAIDHNCRLHEVPAHALPDAGDPAVHLHWRSPAEIAAHFAEWPDAVARAGEIAGRCGPALPDGRPIWPALDLPAAATPDAALRQQALTGLAAQFEPTPPPHTLARLDQELAAIARSGFAPLFLLVADVVRFARSQNIPISTRGSVANSLVAFCIGITTVDPIAHDLLFERFLNPARQNLPDIDLDFCSRRRDEVLDYVRQKHGEERVALVATISTMLPKSALRETAKAHGLDAAAIDRLIRKLPRGWHPDPRRRDVATVERVLAAAANAAEAEVIRRAFEIIGQPHHLSIHPGGVVIAPGPLTDYLPLQWSPKGFLITQFSHEEVEAVGLPKLDLLGIRALTVLADAAALVQRHHDPDFSLDAIPLDDPAAAELLSRGETVGVFQCESTGAQRTLRKLRARTIFDLAVANAFFKPGPALGGMADHFVRRYRGLEPPRYLHPALTPILARTQGVLIFQEQILRLATEIAGLSWAEADHLRRGMSKFQPEEMQRIAAAFIAGCQRPPPQGPGLTPAQAQTLWAQVEPFAGYGFNQGHATAYAGVSYRSAYLKAHWPAAFLCARLQDWGGFHHPAVYIAEARRLGIVVRPPHVNHSGRKFTLAWLPGPGASAQPVLWMGLGQVRDLRSAAVRALLAERRRRPFADLRDLLARTALQSKEITHLIRCGALDGLGESRAALLAELAVLLQAGDARQLAFDFLRSAAAAEGAAQRWAWERQVLGQPLSPRPSALLARLPAPAAPLAALMRDPGRRGQVVGVRLPGWPGNQGFFLADDDDYVVAIPAHDGPLPRPWEPLLVQGRWRVDAWGGGWLAVEGWENLAMTA